MQLIKEMDFNEAIDAIVEGKKVTRKEWENESTYCFMQDEQLRIHTDKDHTWVIKLGDIEAIDWYII